MTVSKRQTECLYLAAQGKHRDEIAQEMNISPGVVRNYLERARKRLNAKNTLHAYAMVQQEETKKFLLNALGVRI